MINVKSQIYTELEKICSDTTDTYPTNWSKMPCIQYLEEENKPHEIIGDGEEVTSYIRYRVDIWDKKSTSQLSLQVNDVFSKFGFKRTTSQDTPEPDNLKHKVMRFEGIIDTKTEIVYQNN